MIERFGERGRHELDVLLYAAGLRSELERRHTNAVWSVSFSSDGKMMALGLSDNRSSSGKLKADKQNNLEEVVSAGYIEKQG